MRLFFGQFQRRERERAGEAVCVGNKKKNECDGAAGDPAVANL